MSDRSFDLGYGRPILPLLPEELRKAGFRAQSSAWRTETTAKTAIAVGERFGGRLARNHAASPGPLQVSLPIQFRRHIVRPVQGLALVAQLDRAGVF